MSEKKNLNKIELLFAILVLQWNYDNNQNDLSVVHVCWSNKKPFHNSSALLKALTLFTA